jgi:AbrB family looped-hinge helix DNA binding protein
MATMKARLSSKGQIVLPKYLRDRRGWSPGTVLDVEEVPEGVLLRFVKRPPVASVEDLLGCTGYRGPRRSLAEMDAAIRDEAMTRR